MSTIPALRPSLENGDRMDREEFHRRYSERPDLQHVELIEGVVYLPSPIRFEAHSVPQGVMLGWLLAYAARHPDVTATPPATVLLDSDNVVEPDAMLFANSAEAVGPTGYVESPPDLVVEIAASSVSRDLHDKLRAYERNGVREYIVWRVLDDAIDWFALRDGRYVRREPGASGIIESEQFPGLRLDVPKALALDLPGVTAAIA
jgi:Uma2 family endonuclease